MKILDLSLRNILPGSKRPSGLKNTLKLQSVNRVRKDIADWKQALRLADNVNNPRRYKLIDLYEDICLDALLTSQMELRMQKTIGSSFVLKDKSGKINADATALLENSPWFYEITKRILESRFYGHTLLEFTTDTDGDLIVETLDRKHVVPQQGLLLKHPQDTKGVEYRIAREYGKWVLEFGENQSYGILNKAVPHVLFKKFAQACWSELCEIYGIPPRVMKTNTQDPELLKRAKEIMQDMGSAAAFVIDETEEFEFAKGADTNGDVYNNLMQVCNNELSLLISGAVIGQDTKNGNRSKEEVSLKQLESLVVVDKRLVETAWNKKALKALFAIGFLPTDGLTIKFQPEEDLEKLWKMTSEALQHYDVEPNWVKSKFGIEVIGKKETPQIQFANPSGGFFV